MKKTEDKKRFSGKLAVIVICSGMAVIYFGITAYFHNRFLPSTMLNGINVSGKSAEQVETMLKEEIDGYNIEDEVIRYIATNIKSNIRELEGALNKLVALSNLEKREINISMAEEVLKDIISPNNRKEVTPQVILETVAEHYGISPSDIIGSKRNAEIVLPRQIVMYLCREITDTSYKNIGILLGNRDHSTIISGDNKVREKLQSNDNKLKNNIEIIRKKLSSN